MERINCIHYCGYSNCAHPDKGWLIWGKGCILTGDGFASECKNKTASEPPPIALDIKGKKIGLYIPDPPKPPPKRKICEDIFKVPDIPYIPPMPEVKPPKSGYQIEKKQVLANGLKEKQMIFYCRMLGFSGRKSKKTSEDVEKQHALIKEFEAQIRQDQKEKCVLALLRLNGLRLKIDDSIRLQMAIMEAD